jgi:hypothetical protein
LENLYCFFHVSSLGAILHSQERTELISVQCWHKTYMDGQHIMKLRNSSQNGSSVVQQTFRTGRMGWWLHDLCNCQIIKVYFFALTF